MHAATAALAWPLLVFSGLGGLATDPGDASDVRARCAA